MEISSNFYIAAFTTAFCFFFVFLSSRSPFLFSSRSKKSDRCNCMYSCTTGGGNQEVLSLSGSGGEKYEKMPVGIERQSGSGASMMEQLVPEITTHTLSYLDFPSLCRLSMTNSSMRKAANDDSAWKALYHKDFTAEQDTITPPNGWKLYYAATRAIVNVNAEFYNIIRDRSLQAMRHFWLRADYIKCIHSTGELFTGYDAVIQSWQHAFGWGQGVAFQVRDVKARLMTDMAWVTMKAYVDMETEPFHVTNVYELHNGQWYMVHHHSSLTLTNAELANQNAFGGLLSMAANLIPTPLPPPQSLLHHRNHHYSNTIIKPKTKLTPLCSTPSGSSSPLVSTQSETSIEDTNKLPFRGCNACGREEIEEGCNGEGRIQGGIATVPGFGWWPIKAFRPCPGLVESGGRYRRRGQSMDEVAWGRSEREANTMSIDELKSSKKTKTSKKVEG